MLKKYNEDYQKGMRLLLSESKKQKIGVRHYAWIPTISLYLSKRNLCYNFWRYTIDQGNLSRIKECHTLYDIFHRHSLFLWYSTTEGHNFWQKFEEEMCGMDLGRIASVRLIDIY